MRVVGSEVCVGQGLRNRYHLRGYSPRPYLRAIRSRSRRRLRWVRRRRDGSAPTKSSLRQLRLLGGLLRRVPPQHGGAGAGASAARSAGIGPLPASGRDASSAGLETPRRSAMTARCALRRRFSALCDIWSSYFRLLLEKRRWWRRSCRSSISESTTLSSMCCHQTRRHSHECNQALYAPLSRVTMTTGKALSAAERALADGRSRSSSMHARTSAKCLAGTPSAPAYRS